MIETGDFLNRRTLANLSEKQGQVTAAACAEAGKFDDAIAAAQRACDVAGKNGETNLLQQNRQLLELYQSHKAVREL